MKHESAAEKPAEIWTSFKPCISKIDLIVIFGPIRYAVCIGCLWGHAKKKTCHKFRAHNIIFIFIFHQAALLCFGNIFSFFLVDTHTHIAFTSNDGHRLCYSGYRTDLSERNRCAKQKGLIDLSNRSNDFSIQIKSTDSNLGVSENNNRKPIELIWFFFFNFIFWFSIFCRPIWFSPSE